MSGYLLDTSVIIDYLRKKSLVIEFVDGLEEDVYSSFVCLAELYVGVFRDANPIKAEQTLNVYSQGLTEILGLNQEVTRHFGEIIANLYKIAQPIGEMDALIAATCIANDLTLVTKNAKHFYKIPGLRLLAL